MSVAPGRARWPRSWLAAITAAATVTAAGTILIAFDPLNPYRVGSRHGVTLSPTNPDCPWSSWSTTLGNGTTYLSDSPAVRVLGSTPAHGELEVTGSQSARFRFGGTDIRVRSIGSGRFASVSCGEAS